MYHAIVRRRARRMFEHELSDGDHTKLIAQLASDVVHRFAGEHALGGTRTSRDQFATWLARVGRLFPSMRFAVEEVVAAGWPWRTVVTVRWRDWGQAADGEPYENSGCHVITLRWGRATELNAYLDTAVLTASLDRMAASGFDEAAAPPIGVASTPVPG